MFIGIDDTDSAVTGMCTTYLAAEIMLAFPELDVIGHPRLIRLNPMVPWKTRGNGAVSLELGKGKGRRFPIAMIDGRTIYGYEGKEGEGGVGLNDAEERLTALVERWGQFSDERTNPGFVITAERPPEELFWRAVREVITVQDARGYLPDGSVHRGFKNGRGIIGSSASIAWNPEHDRTYEIIAYRSPERWGTERKIDEASVMDMDERFPHTFNNYDRRNGHIAISPNSPCPVLFGIRGDAAEELIPAMEATRGEEKDRWTLFLTNQGTDQHIVEAGLGEIKPFSSYHTTGTVSTTPQSIEGGHIIASITDGKDEVYCAAYEPTKEFREVISLLRPGDQVEVWGGVSDEKRDGKYTINLEKVRVVRAVDTKEKVANPLCPSCGKRMKSVGRGAGYRCAICGRKAGEDEAEFRITKGEDRIKTGYYEVPICAARHLSMPLKRMRK